MIGVAHYYYLPELRRKNVQICNEGFNVYLLFAVFLCEDSESLNPFNNQPPALHSTYLFPIFTQG